MQIKRARPQTHAPRQRRGALQTAVAFDSSAVAWCYRSSPSCRLQRKGDFDCRQTNNEEMDKETAQASSPEPPALQTQAQGAVPNI